MNIDQHTKKDEGTPRFLIVLAYFLAIGSFLVGFWHAYLGLKGQMFFGSEYGALLIAATALAFVSATYGMLIRGKLGFLFPYLLASIAMMIFNINYFYPADFKEDLVKEAATELKDSLNSYTAIFNSSLQGAGSKSNLAELQELKINIYNEIKNRAGRGSVVENLLARFNSIIGTKGIPPTIMSRIGALNTKEAEDMDKVLLGKIRLYTLKSVGTREDIAQKIIFQDSLFQSLKENSLKKLEKIETDTTKINISDVKRNIENNPKNIAIIIDIATKANTIIKGFNETKKMSQEGFRPINSLNTEIKSLGEIQHTLPSIYSKLNGDNPSHKVGTIKNILLVIFFDLAIPLVMFFILNNTKTTKKKSGTDPKKIPSPK